MTSYSYFQTNILAKFVDIISIFFYKHSPYFLCHCSEYKLLALQVRILEENKRNATTQQFITAKISGCALKQGSKTHSSLRQSNLQLRNEAALIIMSCRIRAVEHRKCTAGLSSAHPGLQDGIFMNYTRIENAHKVRKNTFYVLLYVELKQTYFFFLPAETSKMLECFYVKTIVFELVQQFHHATEIGNAANAVSACADHP